MPVLCLLEDGGERGEVDGEIKKKTPLLHAVAAMVCSELFGSMTRRLREENKAKMSSVNSK